MERSSPIREPRSPFRVKSFRMRSYEKCARKPFKITSFENKELKVPSNHILAKKRGGGTPGFKCKCTACLFLHDSTRSVAIAPERRYRPSLPRSQSNSMLS